MRIVDNVVYLETFDECFGVFVAPSSYDYKSGGSLCAFYAGVWYMKTPVSVAEKLSLGFDNDTIERYWTRLYSIDFKLPAFDFDKGVEVGGDHDLDYARSPNSPTLIVAKFIHEHGFDRFDFEFYDDHKQLFQGIKVTDTQTGKVFVFSDIEDYQMYASLYYWVSQHWEQEEQESREQQAADFVQCS